MVLPEMATIKYHGSRDDAILRKHAGDRSADGRCKKRQIEDAGFLDSAMEAGCFKSPWRGDARYRFLHEEDLFRWVEDERIACRGLVIKDSCLAP